MMIAPPPSLPPPPPCELITTPLLLTCVGEIVAAVQRAIASVPTGATLSALEFGFIDERGPPSTGEVGRSTMRGPRAERRRRGPPSRPLGCLGCLRCPGSRPLAAEGWSEASVSAAIEWPAAAVRPVPVQPAPRPLREPCGFVPLRCGCPCYDLQQLVQHPTDVCLLLGVRACVRAV
jgi:hypothetical protein